MFLILFSSFSENRKLGENVRYLREQGLTFSQISEELKVFFAYKLMKIM